MKGAATKTVGLEKRNYRKPVARYSTSFLSCLVVMFLAFGSVRAQEQWPHVVPSKDGTPISYEIYGVGEPSLVCLFMVGAAMLATGVHRCHISLKIIALSCWTLLAMATQVQHVRNIP